jgi:hypothetical protein
MKRKNLYHLSTMVELTRDTRDHPPFLTHFSSSARGASPRCDCRHEVLERMRGGSDDLRNLRCPGHRWAEVRSRSSRMF